MNEEIFTQQRERDRREKKWETCENNKFEMVKGEKLRSNEIFARFYRTHTIKKITERMLRIAQQTEKQLKYIILLVDANRKLNSTFQSNAIKSQIAKS